jgi:hypothetical protein
LVTEDQEARALQWKAKMRRWKNKATLMQAMRRDLQAESKEDVEAESKEDVEAELKEDVEAENEGADYEAGVSIAADQNASKFPRLWADADTELKMFNSNSKLCAHIQQEHLPDREDYLYHYEIPEKVFVGTDDAATMRPITWRLMKTILSPQVRDLEGLEEQFPDEGGKYFVGIVNVDGKEGCSVFSYRQTIIRKLDGSVSLGFYKRIGADYEGRVQLSAFGKNSGGSRPGVPNLIKTPCKKGVNVYVYRIICAVYNGVPLCFSWTVDHLGHLHMNHPHWLRFCSSVYNTYANSGEYGKQKLIRGA